MLKQLREPIDGDVVDLRVVRQRTPEELAVDRPVAFDAAMVGMGYVGLPTALAFTHAGCRVLGYDVSDRRLDCIRDGAADLLPSDHERLRSALGSGTLTLSQDARRLHEAALVVICVPTPVDRQLTPDLTMLRSACATVVDQARAGQVIVLTSTTYVGTTRELLVGPLESRGLVVGRDVFVAFSPERIDPGNDRFAQEDVPRVVGGVTQACAERAEAGLKAYVSRVHRVSSPEAAEATKLFENTFRAVNIALVNEFAQVSPSLGIDVVEVLDAAGTKPYGFMKFAPGPGVGGHCIPCDPHYLLWQLRAERLGAPLIDQAMVSIGERPRHVVARALELLAESGRSLRGARVLVVGASYKPGVADVRESPSLEIIERLLHAGSDVELFDPLVDSIRLDDGRVLANAPDAPSRQYDLVLVATLHPDVDYGWVADHPLVLDTTYRFDAVPHRAVL